MTGIETPLTTENKLVMLTGYDGFSALRIPGEEKSRLRMSDGPFGVKGSNAVSVCFPNTCLMASSFDREICYDIGRAIGSECRKADVNLLLAPAVNIKRNPLAGRNFEYYSEDPLLTGALASEYVKGLHSMNVGAVVKHFACNNQENMRWTQNSVVNEDALRNIYLRAFETIVRGGFADAIMSSYNRVNGEYMSQNSKILKDILRDEWEFEGVTVSDWASVADVVKAMKNGLDLEMPGNAELSYPKLKAAYENGTLTEKEINEKTGRLFALAEKVNRNAVPEPLDAEKMIRYTAESFVLLKNEGVLPCGKEEKIAVIGRAAAFSRVQGGGCAELKRGSTLSPLDEIKKVCADVYYTEDYTLTQAQIKELGNYDKIIIFLSLDAECDSEAFDRKDLFFSEAQTDCVNSLKEYKDKVAAVLSNGSAVDLAFGENAGAILETYYAGDFFGAAAARVIFGEISPSGRLAETFPMQLSDVPSYGNYGDKESVVYWEGEYVGYRYYASFGVKPRYPFGFGLSYADIKINEIEIAKTGDYEVEISFSAVNNSSFDGKETVQIYVKTESPFYPKLRLAEFSTVRLKKGEKKDCRVKLGKEAFERYVGGKKCVFEGDISVCVALSSENIIAEKKMSFGDKTIYSLNADTRLGQLLQNDKYRAVTLAYLKNYINYWAFDEENTEKNFEDNKFLKCSVYDMPLRGIAYFSKGEFDEKEIDRFVAELRRV